MNRSTLATLAIALLTSGLMAACQKTDSGTAGTGSTSSAGTSSTPGAPASAASR